MPKKIWECLQKILYAATASGNRYLTGMTALEMTSNVVLKNYVCIENAVKIMLKKKIAWNSVF